MRRSTILKYLRTSRETIRHVGNWCPITVWFFPTFLLEWRQMQAEFEFNYEVLLPRFTVGNRDNRHCFFWTKFRNCLHRAVKTSRADMYFSESSAIILSSEARHYRESASKDWYLFRAHHSTDCSNIVAIHFGMCGRFNPNASVVGSSHTVFPDTQFIA